MMRMGAFVVGGLLGAAAVVMWNRSGKMMRFAGFSSLADTLGNVAADKANAKAETKASDQHHNNAAFTPDNHSSLEDEVSKFAGSDPQLKNQIDEILSADKQESSVRH